MESLKINASELRELQNKCEMAKREHSAIMLKLAEIYPCKLCAPTLLLSETGLTKACEKDCERLKAFNDIVADYQNSLFGNLLPLEKEDGE